MIVPYDITCVIVNKYVVSLNLLNCKIVVYQNDIIKTVLLMINKLNTLNIIENCIHKSHEIVKIIEQLYRLSKVSKSFKNVCGLAITKICNEYPILFMNNEYLFYRDNDLNIRTPFKKYLAFNYDNAINNNYPLDTINDDYVMFINNYAYIDTINTYNKMTTSSLIQLCVIDNSDQELEISFIEKSHKILYRGDSHDIVFYSYSYNVESYDHVYTNVPFFYYVIDESNNSIHLTFYDKFFDEKYLECNTQRLAKYEHIVIYGNIPIRILECLEVHFSNLKYQHNT